MKTGSNIMAMQSTEKFVEMFPPFIHPISKMRKVGDVVLLNKTTI